MNCTPESLTDDAKCIATKISPGMQLPVLISLFCRILNLPPVVCPTPYATVNGGALTDSAVLGNFAGTSLNADIINGNPIWPGVTSVAFNAVTNNDGYTVAYANDLVSLSFPNLTEISRAGAIDLNVQNDPVLATVSAPLLQTLYSLSLSALPALTTVNFNSLNLVGGGLSINSTGLTALNLPALVTMIEDTGVQNCAALTVWNAPLWVATENFNLFFTGNALNQASVDSILAACVANPLWGTAGEQLALTGGTNAHPSVAGLANKAILVGRGATVTNN